MSTTERVETEAAEKAAKEAAERQTERSGVGGAAYRWLDERMGLTDTLMPLLTHPAPKKLNFWYVFGSATLVAFIIQVITGVALALTYVPAPSGAYDSLLFITNDELLGRVVRGLHFWGATAMIVCIAIHTISVFLMGSFKYPREINWLTGSILLLLTLAMAFSGQLLRWDQTAYWSIGVAAAQAGKTPIIGDWLAHLVVAGDVIGGATLTRFYGTHVFLIPALIFLLVGVHLYLVVKEGVSEAPVPGKPVAPATYRQEYAEILAHDSEPFFPDFAWKDFIFGFCLALLLLLLAIFVGPPDLAKPPDPTIIQAYPRPDWYFLPYFAILALLPPAVEDYVILGFPLVAGFIMLVLPFIANKGERAPSRRPWAVASMVLFILAFIVLAIYGDRAPWSPVFAEGGAPLQVPASVLQGKTSQEYGGSLVYQNKGCINCHTIGGVGGNRGPNLTHIGSRLSADQLTWRILGGGNNMPAYAGNMEPRDLSDLVAFLESLK